MHDSPLISATRLDAAPIETRVSNGRNGDRESDVAKSQSTLGQSTLAAGDAEWAPEVTICIPAQAEFVRVVRLAVTGVASRMNFSFDQVDDIKLCVSEACNNAILHASPSANRPMPSVTVTLRPHPDRLEISVTDEGFVPPPGLPASKTPRSSADKGDAALPESGLGLLLIESLMDEVSHQTGAFDRTTVRMVKRTNQH